MDVIRPLLHVIASTKTVTIFSKKFFFQEYNSHPIASISLINIYCCYYSQTHLDTAKYFRIFAFWSEGHSPWSIVDG